MKSASKQMQAIDTPILYSNAAADTVDLDLAIPPTHKKSLPHYAQVTSTSFAKIQELGFEEWLMVNDEGEPQSPNTPPSLLSKIDQLGLEAWLQTAEDYAAPCLVALEAQESQVCVHTEKPNDLLDLVSRLGFETWLLKGNAHAVSQPSTVVSLTLPDEIRHLNVEAQLQTHIYHSYMQGVEWVGYLYHQNNSPEKRQAFMENHTNPVGLQEWYDALIELTGEKASLVKAYPELHKEGFSLGIKRGLEKLEATLSSHALAEEGPLTQEQTSHRYYAYVLGSAWVLGQYYHLQEGGQSWDFTQSFPDATLQAVWHEILSVLPAEKKRELTTQYPSFCAGLQAGSRDFQVLNGAVCAKLTTAPPMINHAAKTKHTLYSPPLPALPKLVREKVRFKLMRRKTLPELYSLRQVIHHKIKKSQTFSLAHAVSSKNKKAPSSNLSQALPRKNLPAFSAKNRREMFFYFLLFYPLWMKRKLMDVFNYVKNKINALLALSYVFVYAFQEKIRTSAQAILTTPHHIKQAILAISQRIKNIPASLQAASAQLINHSSASGAPPGVLPNVPLGATRRGRFYWKKSSLNGIAQTIHRPMAQNFSRIAVLDISSLSINRHVMLAMNQVAPELEELHLQHSQFVAWEGEFIRKIVAGQFASLRVLNVMQTNLSVHSLLQILHAIQQNKLPKLEKLGMDLFSFPVAQRYSQLLFARKYLPLSQDTRYTPSLSPTLLTIQLDLQDASYTPATILRVLLNYLNPGLLQSVVDIQLAGRKLDRPTIALLSAFSALKVLNIADSHYGSCRAFALFSQLADQGIWNGVDLQATGSVFSQALSR
jgi:hypothetical protein